MIWLFWYLVTGVALSCLRFAVLCWCLWIAPAVYDDFVKSTTLANFFGFAIGWPIDLPVWIYAALRGAAIDISKRSAARRLEVKL